MIWEPFVLALVLGLIMSAGLYFAYLWPSIEPLDEDELRAVAATAGDPPHTDTTDGNPPTTAAGSGAVT